MQKSSHYRCFMQDIIWNQKLLRLHDILSYQLIAAFKVWQSISYVKQLSFNHRDDLLQKTTGKASKCLHNDILLVIGSLFTTELLCLLVVTIGSTFQKEEKTRCRWSMSNAKCDAQSPENRRITDSERENLTCNLDDRNHSSKDSKTNFFRHIRVRTYMDNPSTEHNRLWHSKLRLGIKTKSLQALSDVS